MSPKRPCVLRGLGAFALLLGLLGSSDDVFAKSSPEAASVQATLKVTVVLATKQGEQVDPKLKSIASYLKKSFKGFTSFAQKGAHGAKLAVGQKTSTKLPDGKTLTLAYRGVAKGFVKVYLELDGLKTTVDVRDGGLFFQAGRPYQGGILVLAIAAHSGGS